MSTEHVLKLAEALEPDRDPILNEREQTHGPFHIQAAFWDELMFILKDVQMPNPQQRLALTMICVKISRLACHPEAKDHWEDIAGYAKLAAEACSQTEPYARGMNKV